MTIKQMPASIRRITELSPTAREVTLALPENLGFLPGAFVNVFMDYKGTRMRRAYSVSSDDMVQNEITLSIRKGSADGMSERFWDGNIRNVPLKIMGPLGLNTVDKITGTRIFLFGFGIGVSVIKGILPHLLRREEVTHIQVVTGSRTEEEILYQDFFEVLSVGDPRLKVSFVVSRPFDDSYPFKGHIQEHIGGMDFNDASVYICGAKTPAESLKKVIEKDSRPREFLVEAFD